MKTLLTFTLVVTSILVGCRGAGTAETPKTTLQRDAAAEELFRRGTVSAEIGDLTRAEQYFVASLRAGADERRIVEQLLRVCTADQRYPAALEYAEQYLNRHPHDTDVKFAAASVYAAQGDGPRARSLLEAVVRSRPNWPEPHFTLATVLRDGGASPDLADVHDLEYLRIDPNGPLAERARARLRR
jgi:tetratricopeptide (TPR) repeat protein